jgi:hypothetical protein
MNGAAPAVKFALPFPGFLRSEQTTTTNRYPGLKRNFN